MLRLCFADAPGRIANPRSLFCAGPSHVLAAVGSLVGFKFTIALPHTGDSHVDDRDP